MAPATISSTSAPAVSSAWSMFKPATWRGAKVKVAHLPSEKEESQMYYHPELKRWVEKGKEDEAAKDPGSAPPPIFMSAPVAPSAPTRRKDIASRYVIQKNLSVSSSANSLHDGPTTPALTPSTSAGMFPAPPPVGPTGQKFFVPAVPAAAAPAWGAPAVAAEDAAALAPSANGLFTPMQPATSGHADTVYENGSSATVAANGAEGAHGVHDHAADSAYTYSNGDSMWSHDGTGGAFSAPLAADWATPSDEPKGSLASSELAQGALERSLFLPLADPAAGNPPLSSSVEERGKPVADGIAVAGQQQWGSNESIYAISAVTVSADSSLLPPAFAEMPAYDEALERAGTSAPTRDFVHGESLSLRTWAVHDDGLLVDSISMPASEYAHALPEGQPRHHTSIPGNVKRAAEGLHSKGRMLFGALAGLVQKHASFSDSDGVLDGSSVDGDNFDIAMHPGNAAKLDGPLPWELPDHLLYSDQFLSICTTWQRNNPGKLYSPELLLPTALATVPESAAEEPAGAAASGANAAGVSDASANDVPNAEPASVLHVAPQAASVQVPVENGSKAPHPASAEAPGQPLHESSASTSEMMPLEFPSAASWEHADSLSFQPQVVVSVGEVAGDVIVQQQQDKLPCPEQPWPDQHLRGAFNEDCASKADSSGGVAAPEEDVSFFDQLSSHDAEVLAESGAQSYSALQNMSAIADVAASRQHPGSAAEREDGELARAPAFLQQLLQNVRSGQAVSAASLEYALVLVHTLDARRCASDAASLEGRAASLDGLVGATPTKLSGPAASGSDSAAASSSLQTPQRLSSTSPFLVNPSPSSDASFLAGAQAAAYGTPRWPGTPVDGAVLQQQQLEYSSHLAAMKRELQDEYEQQLTARSQELELRFEARLQEMRSELEAEYKRQLAVKDAEITELRQRCHETQDELEHLLLCLGQESRKVTDLAQAMKDAGLDPDSVTGPIEEEYAAMDLP